MTSATRSLWKVLGVAVLIFIVGYIIKSITGQKEYPTTAAFLKVFNLTPTELQAHCGSPDREVAGVLSENDGSRDLYYHDRDNSEIALRFVSDSSTWSSLGAWTHISASDPVGAPLDSVTTLDRLPCIGKEQTDSNLVFFKLKHAMDISLAFVPPAVRDQIGLQLGLLQHVTPRIEPPVRINPPVRIEPLPRVEPLPHVEPFPHVEPLPHVDSPSVEPSDGGGDSDNGTGETGGGDGGPPDTEMPRPLVAIPCPPDTDPCKVIDAVEFIADLKQAVTAGQENDFERINDWLNQLTDHGNVIVQLPELELDRAETIKAILQLHAQAVNIVTARLRADVKKLQPFQWDSPEDTRRKLELVMRTDGEVKTIWQAAAQEARRSSTSSSDSSSRGGSLHFESKAYQQAVHIHLTGSWGSN